MNWELKSDRPIYTQLIEQIELRIAVGVYSVGQHLPSVRDMAAQTGVNPNTMQKALAELERQGLVYSQRTSGRYITQDAGVVKRLKASLAKMRIGEFLEQMQTLGFRNEETLSLLQSMMEEKTP